MGSSSGGRGQRLCPLITAREGIELGMGNMVRVIAHGLGGDAQDHFQHVAAGEAGGNDVFTALRVGFAASGTPSGV
jgi:hypothetical protein